VAEHRIVCTVQEPYDQPTTHAHIVSVGIGSDPDKASDSWTLRRVLDAMANGDQFYTQGVSSGKVARVQAVACSVCRHTIIRSSADAVYDNNLDSLRRCRPFS
jgi:hypothetical protein